MNNFSGQCLTVSRVGPALEISLHSEPLNEIGTKMLEELSEVAELITKNQHGAHSVIWHSKQRGFCAGADLRELQAGLASRRESIQNKVKMLPSRRVQSLVNRGLHKVSPSLVRWEISRFIDQIHDVFNAFDQAPVPTIAAVHGVCFGGGFELALTADLIIADKTARFCFPELRLGIIPGFGGIPRLKRDVGNAVVRDLLLTGRSLRAHRAHELGLVSQLVSRGKALAIARNTAAQLERFEPSVLLAAKRFVKPLPVAELEAEKKLFCTLVTEPTVLESLTKFVESDSVRPYLPS